MNIYKRKRKKYKYLKKSKKHEHLKKIKKQKTQEIQISESKKERKRTCALVIEWW
jgi:hypothetical protein